MNSLPPMFFSFKNKRKAPCNVQKVGKNAARVTTPGCEEDIVNSSSPGDQEDSLLKNTGDNASDIAFLCSSDDSPPGYLHTKDVPSQVVTNPKDSSSDHVTLFSSDDASPEETNHHILGSTDGLLAANDDSDQEVDGVASNCPKIYMTKHRKFVKKIAAKQTKKTTFSKAIGEFKEGKFKSLRSCARFYKVAYTTLHRLMTNPTCDEYKGSGKNSKCLTLEEESKIMDHLKWRASTGCGVNYSQLQSLIQEVLLAVKEANPDRVTGYEDSGQMPERSFIRRLISRHNIKLRRTAEISKGICTFYIILEYK